MKELYTTYINKFEQAKAIAQKYDLSTEKADTAIDDIRDFRITVPLIGGFSTGKSSLINCALGRDLLSTEITPETAVPAEICYGKDSVVYVSGSGTESGTVEGLNTKDLSIDKVNLVQITLENDFLKTIPTVKIVDMPGFDSGYEIHNRAIDEYLPKSLAYIIAVSADEGTLRESVLNFLAELKLNEMPAYAVITKSDKIPEDQLAGVRDHVKATIESKLGLGEVKVAVTSADDEECDGFKEILADLQGRSEEVFVKHFRSRLIVFLNDIRTYLASQLRVKDYSSEEIEAEIEKLEDSIAKLNEDVAKEKEKFDKQCERCIEQISTKVTSNLQTAEQSIVNSVISGNSVDEKINAIVRNTITAEIHSYFEPQVKAYIEDIGALVSECTAYADMSVTDISSAERSENEEIRGAITSAITPLTTVLLTGAATWFASTAAGAGIAAALGMTVTGLGAVLGPIGAGVGLIVGTLIGRGMRKNQEKKKREEAEQKVSQAIVEISAMARDKVKETIYQMRDKINESIDTDINEKAELHRKALSEAQHRLKENEQAIAERFDALNADMQTVNNMIRAEG